MKQNLLNPDTFVYLQKQNTLIVCYSLDHFNTGRVK